MIVRVRSRLRGLSVIEFVVASSLILGVLVASGVTIANIERALAENRSRDGATLLVANVLNQAQQFSCQMTVDPALASGESTRCLKRLAGAAQGTDTAGDMMFKATFPAGCRFGTDPGCVSYTAMVTSRWLHSDEDPSACQGVSRQPSLLRRTIEVRWRTNGSAEEVVSRTSMFQSPPPSNTYDPTLSRRLLVRAAPGTVVALTASTGGTLLRVAQACTGGGEAWFPFLPAAGAQKTFTVSAGPPLTGASLDAAWAAGALPLPTPGSGKTVDDSTPSCALWEIGSEVRSCS